MVDADFSGTEKETAAEVGADFFPFHWDVTKEDEVVALYAAAREEFGHVDTALNVAVIGALTPMLDASLGRRGPPSSSEQGVRLNAICPGFIATEIMGKSGGEKSSEICQKSVFKRAGAPQEGRSGGIPLFRSDHVDLCRGRRDRLAAAGAVLHAATQGRRASRATVHRCGPMAVR